jgi:hypothetical protein
MAINNSMNVLILTPDRVGSTLLQRLITIYMNAHTYDKPVINLHELTNGLESYYSDIYNKEILGKPKSREWGYYQKLEEVTTLLRNADHYKTCRLARYHIVNRFDSLPEQVQFYNYINENFYVISARRNNLFEHAISWGIHGVSKKLNVFTHQEKIDTFYNIYKNGVTIHPTKLTKHLNDYKEYINWCDTYFNVSSYFDYEKDLKNIEKYILGLDIFPNQERKTWEDIFDIPWTDWNKCHKLVSDFGGSDIKLLENNTITDLTPTVLQTSLSLVDQNYLIQHGPKYVNAHNGIAQLVFQGALVTNVPIKLQTLAEKRKIIKNFDECVEVYNKWVDDNGMGIKYTHDELKLLSNNEVKEWYNDVPKNLLLE